MNSLSKTISGVISLFILFILLSPINAIGQGQVASALNSKMNLKQLSNHSLVEDVTESMSSDKYANTIDANLLTTATFFEVDRHAISTLRTNDVDLMQMPINVPGFGEINLNVYRQTIFTSDLVIQTNDGVISNKEAKRIMFYRGIVQGMPSSIVSLTISDNEISGMISIGSDNFNIGKIKGISTHILYNDKDLNLPHDFVCGTADPEIEDAKPVTINANKTTQCVRIRVEVDSDLASQLGGVAGSVTYVAGLYNEVITLYDNDNITVNVSEVYVWNGSSPYSGNASQILGQMSNTSANSDITTLLSKQGSGGIAYVPGLCSTGSAVNFNSVDGFYSSVPTFSWDVEVVAHEMGHNLNSPHTHACAWNGNNTAIDGCGANAGYSEGCEGDNPAGGGTIMSYCHLTSVGINFTLGFGAQPGQRIRDYVDGSPCLGTVCVAIAPTCDDGILNGTETDVDCGGQDCDVCPTCDDGLQNGNETGVDCGGSLCIPCNCSDVAILLTLNFDNYPEETSWELINSSSVVVASGGTYGSEPDGSTLTVPMCVPAGCYDFVIDDSFGDGMCCGVGQGSYDLSDFEGNSYASGGDFGDGETTNFCLESSDITVDLNLSTLLQGPYDQASSLMSDNLRSSGDLPLNEPYSAMGYAVPAASTSIVVLGTTGNDAIVDWILVELRSGADPTSMIGMQVALLQRDGDIVSTDGVSPVSMNVGTESNVYVVLRHRNHFGVRSLNSYSTSAAINLDFSDPVLSLYGTDAMLLVVDKNVMVAGDANSDGQVNSIDKNSHWRVQNGTVFDYATFRADMNLDGAVNSVDKNVFWRQNNSKTQQLD